MFSLDEKFAKKLPISGSYINLSRLYRVGEIEKLSGENRISVKMLLVKTVSSITILEGTSVKRFYFSYFLDILIEM